LRPVERSPDMNRCVRFAVAGLAALAVSLSTALAAPSNTAISSAYQVSRCSSSVCGPGDPKLSSGTVATGAVQIDVTSDANLGLQSVQLQAIGGGESMYQCVHLWTPGGAKHFAESATWDTANWPRTGSFTGCTEAVTHKHGEPAPNGSYSLRVVARESGSNQDQTSAEFVLRLSNPSEPPLWRGEPVSTGGAVTLRWYRNAEPDVVEYRLTRSDSKGSKVIAIDAAAPTRTTGCQPEQEATFTCTDHPSAGAARYTLRAYRPTPASEPACKTRATPCVGSAAAPQKTVKVGTTSGATPGPATTAAVTPAATGGSATPTAPATIAPGATPSSAGSPAGTEAATTASAAATNDSGDRTAPVALASIAVAGLVAAHSVRRRHAGRNETA
jgi:hypothetical protein